MLRSLAPATFLLWVSLIAGSAAMASNGLLPPEGVLGLESSTSPADPVGCEPTPDLVTLVIEGFGRAHFEDFEADAGGGWVELRGDVCIEAENGSWTVIASRALVSGISEGQEFSALVEEPRVRLDGWDVTARLLEASGDSLTISDAVFSAPGVVGSASTLTAGVDTQEISARDVQVEGEDFRLQARRAELQGDAVVMSEALITTCICPGQPFYTVAGRGVRLEIAEQRLIVSDGRLDIAGLSIALGEEFELSSERLSRLRAPLAIEYLPGSTGLGLIAPYLEVAEGLTLEMGLLGLDGTSALQAFALVHYRDDGNSFSIGRSRGGPRADAQFVRPLTEAVDAIFALRNRHEAASDFLHEGLLQLSARPAPVDLGSSASVSLRGDAFAAVSSQVLSGATVASPRLGAGAGATLAVPLLEGGSLTVALDGQYTTYPDYSADQYSVYLRPTWRFQTGPLGLNLGYERRWTDGDSPFSSRLDRLSPLHSLSFATTLGGELAEGVEYSAGIDVVYDLLALADGPPGGLERLGLSFGVAHQLGQWELSGSAGLELAGVLDPAPGSRRRGRLSLSVDGVSGGWELGSSVQYSLLPGSQGLSLLEARGALPLEFDDVELTPYLALDFAPLLNAGELPSVSGHGLQVTWNSCCGTISAGYRQQGDEFTTSFGLALAN